MKRKTWSMLAVFAFLLLGLARPGEAMTHPNLARGYSADGSFQPGLVDNVNLFTGSLNLVIPLGQRYPVSQQLSYGFSLTYSSNLWEFTDYGPAGIDAEASSLWNAGLGWRLSMGELWVPTERAAESSSMRGLYLSNGLPKRGSLGWLRSV